MSRLDLLLITDGVLPLKADRYAAYRSKLFTSLFGGFGVTNAEARALESRLGVSRYLTWVSPTEGEDRMPVCVPVFPWRPSLALANLATVARAGGYSVAIVDNVLRYDFQFEKLACIVNNQRPRVIGISTTFISTPAAVKKLVRSISKLAPGSRVVIGGPTVRRYPELHGVADVAVFGAGEGPLIGVLEAVSGNRSLASVPNIAFRGADGAVAYGPMQSGRMPQVGEACRTDLSAAIPVPDWSLYPRSRDVVYPIELSRGCKHNCYFCSHERGKQIRGLDDIRAELLANARLGIRKYRFGDCNFADGPARHPRYPQDVCELIAELDLGLEWSCYARVESMTPQLGELMRRSGCFAVFFGVESGDDSLLKMMRKGYDVADARRGIASTKAAGIFVHANFVIGFPGETPDTFRRTLDFILSTRPDSVALSKFEVDDNAPIMGAAARDQHQLRGAGIEWRHTSMSSETVGELIAEGQQVLAREGIVLGSEYEIAAFMSVGLSFAECREVLALRRRVVDDSTPGPELDEAISRLRQLYLERIPRAIAEEQRAMRADV